MKLLLASTSGGHFSTMSSLKPFWMQHDRVWATDLKPDTKSLIDSREKVHWVHYPSPRDLVGFSVNTALALKIVLTERPDLILSTGASIAVSFAIASKLLGSRFIYIESISRSKELSLTGKLVYPLSDEFYVQWSQLCQKYPKAIFKGYVV